MAVTGAVFFDKDGTLVRDVPYNADPDRVTLQDGAGDAARRLHEAGYRLIVVSNQSGVARGLFPESALRAVEEKLRALLASSGAQLDAFLYCPHLPNGSVAAYARACECRKPAPGMLRRAAREHGVALERSWLVGDILDDIEAGRRAGCRTILVDAGNETEWALSKPRLPDHVVAGVAEAAEVILAFDGALPARRGERP